MTDRDFIENYLEYYEKTQGVLPERIEGFRERYQDQGFLTREQLYEIAYESSTRSAHHVRENPEERCKEVTGNVLKVEGDYSKIPLICALKGFKAPTASSVLACLSEEHAIVDTRVWASLERLGYLKGRKESFSPEDYIDMIEPIREIAAETGFTPEEVGYALFAYDADVREGNLH
jgi:thermostable 8-oxoguanine DNA glycosylase